MFVCRAKTGERLNRFILVLICFCRSWEAFIGENPAANVQNIIEGGQSSRVGIRVISTGGKGESKSKNTVEPNDTQRCSVAVLRKCGEKDTTERWNLMVSLIAEESRSAVGRSGSKRIQGEVCGVATMIRRTSG